MHTRSTTMNKKYGTKNYFRVSPLEDRNILEQRSIKFRIIIDKRGTINLTLGIDELLIGECQRNSHL